MYKDLSGYREGRSNCLLVQNYLSDIKPKLLRSCLDELSDANPEVIEIVMDTFIGWFNSPVGRSFVDEVLYEKKYSSFQKGWKSYYQNQMVENVIFKSWAREESSVLNLVQENIETVFSVVEYIVDWLDSKDAKNLFLESFGEVIVMDYSEGS